MSYKLPPQKKKNKPGREQLSLNYTAGLYASEISSCDLSNVCLHYGCRCIHTPYANYSGHCFSKGIRNKIELDRAAISKGTLCKGGRNEKMGNLLLIREVNCECIYYFMVPVRDYN